MSATRSAGSVGFADRSRCRPSSHTPGPERPWTFRFPERSAAAPQLQGSRSTGSTSRIQEARSGRLNFGMPPQPSQQPHALILQRKDAQRHEADWRADLDDAKSRSTDHNRPQSTETVAPRRLLHKWRAVICRQLSGKIRRVHSPPSLPLFNKNRRVSSHPRLDRREC